MNKEEAREVIDRLSYYKLRDFEADGLNKAIGVLSAVDGSTSDGYHTFDELYYHRMCLTSELTRHVPSARSLLHDDGTMFEGHFIVVFQPTSGKMCSYHYPIEYWDLFSHCVELANAPKWDGHTANDVCNRLLGI